MNMNDKIFVDDLSFIHPMQFNAESISNGTLIKTYNIYRWRYFYIHDIRENKIRIRCYDYNGNRYSLNKYRVVVIVRDKRILKRFENVIKKFI